MRLRKSWATTDEEDAAEDELLIELELELDTGLDDEELLATTQSAAIFWVTRMMVLLESFLMRMCVQPLVAKSDAGKESSPQPPSRSTLKRGPPFSSPWVKLRQISRVVDESATDVNISPSFQPLWVPRRWKPFAGTEDEELILELELELELELKMELELELSESTELKLLELELLGNWPKLLIETTELLDKLTVASEDDDGGVSSLVELA